MTTDDKTITKTQAGPAVEMARAAIPMPARPRSPLEKRVERLEAELDRLRAEVERLKQDKWALVALEKSARAAASKAQAEVEQLRAAGAEVVLGKQEYMDERDHALATLRQIRKRFGFAGDGSHMLRAIIDERHPEMKKRDDD